MHRRLNKLTKLQERDVKLMLRYENSESREFFAKLLMTNLRCDFCLYANRVKCEVLEFICDDMAQIVVLKDFGKSVKFDLYRACCKADSTISAREYIYCPWLRDSIYIKYGDPIQYEWLSEKFYSDIDNFDGIIRESYYEPGKVGEEITLLTRYPITEW